MLLDAAVDHIDASELMQERVYNRLKKGDP
jgi:hypothetical protein